jgi:long-subunit acyl-CoA synthetase (AMP-forming)
MVVSHVFTLPVQITCSGENVMIGYHNNPTATAEVFYTHNGQKFFRTGDMGKMVEGKFLKITGRIKEQFKLENGKYVVPAPLEDLYSRSPFIAQMFITGNNNPHPIALIVPNYANLLPWCQKHATELAAKAPTPQELADPTTKHLAIFDEPAFKDLITQEVRLQHQRISIIFCISFFT